MKINIWTEIFQSIRKNMLRSTLSGFTVVFGVFVFTILFGIATGLKNTFNKEFRETNINTIFVYSGITSKPYKGRKAGRKIQFKNQHIKFLNQKYDSKIEHSSGGIYKNMNMNVSYFNKNNNYMIYGTKDNFQFIKKFEITSGRFFSYSDTYKKLKVAVIGTLLQEDIFGKKNPIGKQLNIQGISFKVIGVHHKKNNDRENRKIYIPYTTAQDIYQNNDYIDMMYIAHSPDMNHNQVLALRNSIEKDLKDIFYVSPKDNGAIDTWNAIGTLKKIHTMNAVLGLIILFIGLGTLIASIIGISNIMVYSVKERTKELGIRKVLGAKPKYITSLILLETILVTSLSGYIGMLIGFRYPEPNRR